MRRSVIALAVLGLVAALSQLGSAPPKALAASAGAPIIFGDDPMSLADLKSDESALGRQLGGVRIYKKWGDPLLGKNEKAMSVSGHAIFVSVRTVRSNGARLSFATIAAARPGTQAYNDIVAMATTIKGFGARVNFIFEHEPDARSSLPSGNGAQFVAAWRNIWNVFHARGLTSANVRFVATYTGVIFTRASPRNIKDYYPGDAYVDAVAIDPYNWSWCRGEHWKELGYLIESQRLWGLAHPSKQLMIMEFGSPEDKSSAGHKAQWIRNAEALFKLPAYHQYTAVLYFTGRVVSGGCPWDFKSSSSSLAAFRSMTNDPAYLGRG